MEREREGEREREREKEREREEEGVDDQIDAPAQRLEHVSYISNHATTIF